MTTKAAHFPMLSRITHRAGVVNAEPAPDEIKAALFGAGINQRGWRLLLSFGDALLAPLMSSGRSSSTATLPSFPAICALLRLIQQCEMDVLPPPELTRAWMRARFARSQQHLGDVPVGLFRASWLEAVRRQYEGHALHLLLAEELPLVVRWYFSLPHPFPKAHSRHAWQWFHAQAQNWSLRCEHYLSFDTWKPILPTPPACSRFRIIELLSPEAVEDEARSMRHCIDTYISECDRGDYRVFSIQSISTGERVATVGMVNDDRAWIVDDVRGQDNEEVGEAVWALAKQASLYCNTQDALQQRLPF
ncbi:MAG TPA: hypothetical protein PLN31_03290 [Azoarcus taiwanensis]|nr:hypothetical protein [Azoarcus taiwanensis]